jgi:hypothetical protein
VNDSELSVLIKRAESQGFKHRLTERNHHQFYAPDGKTIVTRSGTPSADYEPNFMADMKRAGYCHEPLGTLGDLMPAAAKPNGGAKLSTTQYVIDALARHPEGLNAANLKMVVASQRPDLNANAAYAALNTLKARGIVRMLPSGVYLLTDVDRSNFRTFVRGAKGERLPPPKTNGAHRPTVEAGARTGDDTVDADLQALDNALAALAQIEAVVRRNREVLAQTAALKKLLGVTP